MTYICPSCGGAGVPYDGTDDACPVCNGRAYVIALAEAACPECGGRKRKEVCATCKDTGTLTKPLPFALPVREVAAEDLQRAFVVLTTGGNQLDEGGEVDPFALGIAAGLLTVSRERSEKFGWAFGEMLESLRVGSLRISETGMWHFPNPDKPIAVQILRYPAKG